MQPPLPLPLSLLLNRYSFAFGDILSLSLSFLLSLYLSYLLPPPPPPPTVTPALAYSSSFTAHFLRAPHFRYSPELFPPFNWPGLYIRTATKQKRKEELGKGIK